MDAANRHFCRNCRQRKRRGNPFKGVLIPNPGGGSYTGKCTNKTGLCAEFSAWWQQIPSGEDNMSKPVQTDHIDHIPIEVASALNPEKPGEFDHEKPLSDREKKLRADLEHQVGEAVGQAFVTVGRCLAMIQEQRLYRTTHKSFEAYCKQLWDMARQVAYRYIEAYQVVEQIGQALIPEKCHPMGDISESDSADGNGKAALIRKTDAPEHTIVIPLPSNERQARMLAKVKDPEERVKVWQAAVQVSQEAGKKISAALIRKVCKQFGHLKVEQATRQIDRQASEGKREKALSEPIQTALSALTAQIRAEERAKWKNCNRQQLADILMSLGKDISLYP